MTPICFRRRLAAQPEYLHQDIRAEALTMSRGRAPRIVELDFLRREQALYSARQRWITRSRILNLKQFLGKSVEIMDGPWRSSDRNARFWNKPMGRDRQNGLGFGCCLTHSAPCLCIDIVQNGIHRIAVAEEDCGEYLRHVDAPRSFDFRRYCGVATSLVGSTKHHFQSDQAIP